MSKKENKEGTISLEMQIDMYTNKVIGSISNKEDIQSDDQLDIAARIVNRIQDLFSSDGSDWIDDYLNHIDKHRYFKAYDLLIKKYTFLKQPINISLFNDLLKLDYKKLSKKKQYNFLTYIIALGYKGKFFVQIEPLLDIIDAEYQDFIDKETQGRLYLTKSDIYIKQNNHLSANRLLNVVINDSEYSNCLRAFAYRQLSWLSPLERDKLAYIEHAHDLFLISGKNREAIEELIGLYNILISKSPVVALSKIDLAIQLLETESHIDKEISASLYIKKAGILYNQKLYDESFSMIQKAIELQKDSIGNEQGKYSTYKFAEELMRLIGNSAKQKEYAIIANNLRDKIPRDASTNLQWALEDEASTKQLFSEELEQNIFENGEPEQKLYFLLLSALNQNTPFEKKLNLLDKALEIEKNSLSSIIDKSLLYNTVAEIYSEHGDVHKSIEWFDKTFSIAPFNNYALQNYIKLLWINKFWEQLEDVCKRYIDIAGYSPNLYYTYGKSLLNQTKYDEAFVVLGKCRKDMKFSIDKDILECSEHIVESDMFTKTLLAEKKTITISEFFNASKEVTDTISQRSRMFLWEFNKKLKTYKWKSKPEDIVKNLFIQGIHQKFDPDNFEIIEEVKTGAGRIDLYAIVGSDLKIVIELKMCGGGYSSNYAMDGKDQLVHYLENKKLSYGILIIFDGRTRDFSKSFPLLISINNKIIQTIVVDMRPKK